MKLNPSQIQEIDRLIGDHNIWYDDLKNELTDHVASAVEDRLGQENTSFQLALMQVVEEINPEKIQRLRMLRSLLLPFRWFTLLHPLNTILIFLASAVVLYGATFHFNNGELANKWLAVILIAAATFPALLTLVDQRHKPYKMSFFCSAVLGCFMVTQVLHAIGTFGLESYLVQSQEVAILFYAFAFGLLILGYIAIFRQYQKAKRYSTYSYDQSL